jgi:hypothetical protein
MTGPIVFAFALRSITRSPTHRCIPVPGLPILDRLRHSRHRSASVPIAIPLRSGIGLGGNAGAGDVSPPNGYGLFVLKPLVQTGNFM